MRSIFAGAFGPFSAPTLEFDSIINVIGGQVFYYNPSVSQANQVGTPFPEVDGAVCFDDLQDAVDACVDDRGDVIIMKAGSNVAPSATINFDCNGITFVGQVMGASPGELRCAIDNTDTTGPCIKITKRCHIQGIEFASYNATVVQTTVICILLIDNLDSSVDGQGTWIDNCTFKNNNRDAITHCIFNKGAPNVFVTDCRFFGHVTYAPTAGVASSTSGATLGAGRPGEIHIYDNYFEDCEYMYEALGATRRSVFKGNYGGYSRPNSAWVKGLKWKTTHTVGTNATRVISNWFPGTYDTAHSATRDIMESDGCLFSGNMYEGDLPGSFAGSG